MFKKYLLQCNIFFNQVVLYHTGYDTIQCLKFVNANKNKKKNIKTNFFGFSKKNHGFWFFLKKKTKETTNPVIP